MFPTSTQWLYSWFPECQIIQELFQDRNWAENLILLSRHVCDAVVGMREDAENSFPSPFNISILFPQAWSQHLRSDSIVRELFQDRNWVDNLILLSLHVIHAVDCMIQDAENSFQLLLCAFKSSNTIMSFHYIQSCASLNGLRLQILPKFCHVASNLRILSWVSIIFNHARV